MSSAGIGLPYDPERARQLLSEAGVQSLSLPEEFEGETVGATVQGMQARLEALPGDIEALAAERHRVALERGRRQLLYDVNNRALFEVGSAVIDGRWFNLALRVNDLAAHSAIAKESSIFVIYLEVTGVNAQPFTVAVPATAGAKVKSGDLLLTIEAMKMETGIHAEKDAVVKAVHVSPGGQIDAKDLLVEFE